MIKSRIIAMTAVALLTLNAGGGALAQTAETQPSGEGHSQESPLFKLSEEQQARLDGLRKHHLSSLEPLEQQLIIKRAELQSQMIARNPNPDKVISLHREIGELKGKVAAEHIRFHSELEKQNLPPFMPWYEWQRHGRAFRHSHNPHDSGYAGHNWHNQHNRHGGYAQLRRPHPGGKCR